MADEPEHAAELNERSVAMADEIEVSAIAIKRTRDRGGVHLTEVAEATRLPEAVIQRVVDKLLEQGQIMLNGEAQIRWIDPPPPPGPRTPRSGRAYGVEEIADLLRRIGTWAANWTRKAGAFTISVVERELGLPRSVVVRVLGLSIDAERAIRLDGGAGFVWAGVEVPSGLDRRVKTAPYTSHDWVTLRERFEDWASGFPAVSANRVCQRFGVSAAIASRLLNQLVDEGRMVRLDQQRGYGWIGVAPAAHTLADLIAEARQREDSTYRLPPGRRRKDAAVEVSRLTTTQVTQLVSLAAFIASKMGYASPQQVSLADPLFGWDADRTEWRLVEQVQQWTEPLKDDTRYAHRGTIPLLVAVGEVTGLLERGGGSRHDLFTRTHAAEWQLQIDELAPQVIEANNGRCADSLVTGLRTLARHASRRGQLSIAETDWPTIQCEVDAAFEAGGMAHHSWYYARRAYEIMRGINLIEGPQWIPDQERIAFLPTSAIEAAVSLKFRGWADPDGKPLSLVVGRFGLQAYAEWATAETWSLRANKLPPREFIRPNAAQQALIDSNARRGIEDFRLVPETLRTRLQHINYLLGWIDRHVSDLDVRKLTLEELCNVDLVAGLEQWLRARRKRAGKADTTPPLIGALANELAVIASPFLEARARQDGDEERAERIRERAEVLRLFATAAKKQVIRRKDIQRIARAWRGRDKIPGWIKLLRLRDLIVQDIERLGGFAIEEQADRLLRGELRVTPRWAAKVRAALLVNLVRLIPLRRRAVSGLTTDMWENIPVNDGEHGRPLKPWEGAIILNVPAHLMKSKRLSDPAYIAESSVGRPRHEYGAARALLTLWFAPGGARDEMRRLPDGTLVPSPFLFPAMARMAINGDSADIERLKDRQCRWDGAKLSETFASLVVEYADGLQVDLPALKELGGLRLHIVRLLFGTHWAPRNLLIASRLLDHRDVNLTARIYCGEGVREATREAPLSMMPIKR